MRTFKLYFYGLLVFLFVIFIVQNYYTLTYSIALRLNLGFLSLLSVPLPLFLIAPLFFFCGLFLGSVGGWEERRRLSKEIKQLKSAQPMPQPEPKTEFKPEVKPMARQEFKAEIKPESNPETRTEPWQEAKQEAEPKKKPEEGTIVSSVPIFKKSGSSSENNPSMPS